MVCVACLALGTDAGTQSRASEEKAAWVCVSPFGRRADHAPPPDVQMNTLGALFFLTVRYVHTAGCVYRIIGREVGMRGGEGGMGRFATGRIK